jgi:GPN-loop GTPase
MVDIVMQVNPTSVEVNKNAPVVLLVLGMAGSGKTTFVHRLISYISEQGKKSYNINLDPAVLEVHFPCNIDIRDSVKYKNVMKTY